MKHATACGDTAGKAGGGAKVAVLGEAECQELLRLRRENRRLQMECDILAKACVTWSVPSRAARAG